MAMKCKICGGECGLVCRGFDFSGLRSDDAGPRASRSGNDRPKFTDHGISSADKRAVEKRPAIGEAKGAVREDVKRGRRRKGEEHLAASHGSPWLSMIPPISERTWYRRKKDKGETK